MITFLHGRLAHALPTQATIDVGGVGYEVFIPLSSYDKLPAVGQPIEILTHLHVREDAQILYGFMTRAGARSFSIARQSRQRHRAETGAGGVERNEREQFQSRGGQQRCRVAFEDQRGGKENSGANGAGVERQGRRGGGLGSGQRGACADAGAGTGERSGAGVDRARLQAGRRPQDGARFAGTRRRRENRRRNW